MKKCPHGKSLDEWCIVCAKMFAIEDRAKARIAELEAVLNECDAMLGKVWPHFGGVDAEEITALQERVSALLPPPRVSI